MNAKEFSDLLTLLNACPRAREWAKGKSLQSAWKTCKRGDWLLWLSGHMAGKPGWPTRNEVVLAACDCAETALQYVKAGDDGPRKCIETVRAWADGKASRYDVETARRAAAASYAASYASYAADASHAAAAAEAADAAAYAADAAAYADDAAASYTATAAASATYAPYATYASYAADAATAYAADAAADAAYAAEAAASYAADRTKTLAKCAVIVRKRLYIPKGGR